MDTLFHMSWFLPRSRPAWETVEAQFPLHRDPFPGIFPNIYWDFLDDPKRCGSLNNDRLECYTRITTRWLLFLEGSPEYDTDEMKTLLGNDVERMEYRKLIQWDWTRFLSQCAPGDEDLIDHLRNLPFENAYLDRDLKRIIRWLKVSNVHSNLP